MSFFSDNKIEKLWKSRRTMLEILYDRKYLDAENYHMDLKEFKKWMSGELNITEEDLDELENYKDVKEKMTLYFGSDQDKIKVLWPNESKLATNIRKIVDVMKSSEIKKAIIVVDDGITPWCESTIKSLRNNKIFINAYTLIEAQINIMKHFLVPKQEICSISEKSRLLKGYNISRPNQLPQIYLSDPVVKHLGARKGDIIKITRKSGAYNNDYKQLSYRIVV